MNRFLFLVAFSVLTLALPSRSDAHPDYSPVITSPPTAQGIVGHNNFSYYAMATYTPTSFTFAPLPGGISQNGFQLSGQPTTAGVFVVPFHATNAFGDGPPVNWTVTIADTLIAYDVYDTLTQGHSRLITLGGDTVQGTLTYSLVTQPSHGTLTGTAPKLTYTPNANYTGVDTFTYKVNNGSQDSNPATVSLTVVAPPSAPVLPTFLPGTQTVMDTTLPIQTGNTYTVSTTNSCNDPNTGLQALIDKADYGDTILIPATAICQLSGGSYVLRKKTSNKQGWIVIRTAATDAQLPPPGTRISSTTYGGVMPKILTDAQGESVFVTDPNDSSNPAHHYRLIGLEMTTPTPDPGQVFYMIALGDPLATSTAQQATDIIIDRCYIHGSPMVQCEHGIGMNGIRNALIDSIVSEIHMSWADAQAIHGYNGPGPYKIVNNHLEGSAEVTMFGDPPPVTPGNVPSDLEFRHNHYYKPLSWNIYPSTYCTGGAPDWSMKNLFEIKSAERVIVDGNILENSWGQCSSQNGGALLFNGVDDASDIDNITITHNLVRYANEGMSFCTNCNATMNIPTGNFLFQDNVFEDMYPAPGRFWLHQALNLNFDHNTLFPLNKQWDIHYDGVGFGSNFQNNIVSYAQSGINGDSTPDGTATLWTYLPGYVFENNAIISVPDITKYPPSNFGPTDPTQVGFVNYNGANGGDYHLLPTSPYYQAGTDGKDLGADIDALNTAICGVREGTPGNCSNGSGGGGGSLGTPTLNLPAYVPINSQITAGYTGAPVDHFQWTLTPQGSGGTTGTGGSVGTPSGGTGNTGAGTASFSTHGPIASLSDQPLVLGLYLITVQAFDANGNASPKAQDQTTLVPGDLSGVREYPNPWRSDRGYPQKVIFDTLSVNTTIKIFTVSGHWVKTLPTSSTSTSWDLTNDSGDKVGSGIYLYEMKTADGQKSTGKLAIIK